MPRIESLPHTATITSAVPPPFFPAGLFYGWMMVPVATMAMICTLPGQTFGVSVFLPYIRDGLGLSKSAVAGAYMAGTVFASVPMLLVGMAMDRFGLRRTMTVVVILLACGCAVISQAGNVLSLLLGFLMLRMFGQGSLAMLSGNTLAMWFHRKLGMAAGLLSTGLAVAIAFIPAFNLMLIDHLGWRQAYLTLGALVLATMIPLLAFVFRNRPEEVGQQLDGDEDPEERVETDSSIGEPERAFTARQAMTTRSYWIVAMCAGFWALAITAMIYCAPSIFESRGLTNEAAAQRASMMLMAMGMTLLGGQFIAGVLADRLPLNLMLAGGTLTLGGAAMVARLPDSENYVYLLGVLLGVAQASIVAVQATLWARYYGRRHLGTIRGTLTTMFVALSGVGPLLVDGVYDLIGSYRGVLLGLAIVPIPLAIGALFATPPPLPQHSEP